MSRRGAVRRVILLVPLLLLSTELFAQTGAGKTITIFHLSTEGWGVPPRALQAAEGQIAAVFAGAGASRVVSLDHSLPEGRLTALIEKLRELKRTGVSGPERFGANLPPVSAHDLRLLLDSSFVVVSAVTNYSLHFEQSSGYTASLETRFTLISQHGSSAAAQFSIRTIGVGDSAVSATRQAATAIARQLAYELRGVTGLSVKAEIVDVKGSTVLIERGRSAGIRSGDELAIVEERILPSGRVASERIGLLVVQSAGPELSYGRVLYSNRPVGVGDGIELLRRVGLSTSFYVHVAAAAPLLGSTYAPVVLLGVRQSLTRGLYNFRPIIGFEVPLASGPIGGAESYGGGGLPFDLYLGGELNWRMGRFDLVPLAAAGIGGRFASAGGGGTQVTLVGGAAQISLHYLFDARLRLFVEAGYTQWLPRGRSSGWGGFYGGLGATVVY